MKNIIKKLLREGLINETQYDIKLSCIQNKLKQEINNYNGENYDDKWFEIKDLLRHINEYFENGFFKLNKFEHDAIYDDFLKGLNYSNRNTYQKVELHKTLPKSNIPLYKAIGDKTLFRGVSLKDWERIKSQGFIDSDCRTCIIDTEGTNLGQTLDTAEYYLPHNSKGVILAVSPKDLDLYMLTDDYIRVFEPIPIKNVIKVSDVIITNKHGVIISLNTEQKINDIIKKLKEINISIDC